MTGRAEFRKIGEATLQAVAGTLRESAFSLPERLRALDFHLAKPSRLVLTDGDGREALLQVAWSGYRRNFLVLGNTEPLDEFTRGLEGIEGRATAYLCVGQACRKPETDPGKVKAMLDAPDDPVPATE